MTIIEIVEQLHKYSSPHILQSDISCYARNIFTYEGIKGLCMKSHGTLAFVRVGDIWFQLLSHI